MDQEVEEGTGWELILSAAEGALQIVLTHAEELICAQRWGRNDRATEILAPALADMARTRGLRPRHRLRARARFLYRHTHRAGHGGGTATNGSRPATGRS